MLSYSTIYLNGPQTRILVFINSYIENKLIINISLMHDDNLL